MLGVCFRLTRRLPFMGLLSRRFQLFQQQALSAFERLKDVSFRGSLMSLLTVMIVWVAIFLYIAFYYAYMPSISHSRPIHLEFNSCKSSEVCSYPTAVVKLTRRQQLLMVGQPYKIVIQLDMPESPANRELGMFMVCGKLKNYEKCSSLSHFGVSSVCECSKSCRATMLHYRSPLLQALITLALSPFMIFGNIEEKQTITVELYSEFEDDQSCPVTDIEVQILSQRVELYSAKLGIHAHLMGLRYLMYYWPVTSAVIGVSCNLFFIFFIVSLSWWRLSQYENFKGHYNFSIVSYQTKEKSDYEDEACEDDMESTSTMHPKSGIPSGTPKLKKRTKSSISVASETFEDIEMDVADDQPSEKISLKESTT